LVVRDAQMIPGEPERYLLISSFRLICYGKW
jgi:hypothetical protein